MSMDENEKLRLRNVAALDQCQAGIDGLLPSLRESWKHLTEEQRVSLVAGLREQFEDDIVAAIIGLAAGGDQ